MVFATFLSNLMALLRLIIRLLWSPN